MNEKGSPPLLAPPWGGRANPETGSNFSWAFLFLSADKREALRAVYRFCRHVDDIADSGSLTPSEAQRQLDFWREEIGRLYRGSPTHSISQALLPQLHRFALRQQDFLDVVAGVEMDLRKTRYETFEELEPYLHGVAVAVGLLCVEVFGHRHTPAEGVREYAKNMGYAFQLTNIIRDVGSDLERGRIYLPLEDLRAAGGSVESLVRREHTPAFRSVMARQYERAKLCYQRARNGLNVQDRPSMAPAEVMARVYEGVLEQVRLRDYRVFFEKISLPAWRKASLALSGWARSHGWF